MFRKRKGLIIFVAFVAILAITGSALASSGYFDNPFRIFQIQSGQVGEFGARGRNESRAASPTNSGGETRTFPQRGGEGSGEGQNTIAWSRIGDVLFDVWFLFAATAVVIALQKAFSLVIGQLHLMINRLRRPRVVQPSA